MTNTDFIAKYKSLITVHFNFEALANSPSIIIRETDKALSEFLDFYVPRYAKNNRWDSRPIEQIALDNDSAIVQLKDIVASPAEWGLRPFRNADILSKSLWPIPLATDIHTHRTLVLDSNHTLCTLLVSGVDMRVPCIELVGENLSELGADLTLMQF